MRENMSRSSHLLKNKWFAAGLLVYWFWGAANNVQNRYIRVYYKQEGYRELLVYAYSFVAHGQWQKFGFTLLYDNYV